MAWAVLLVLAAGPAAAAQTASIHVGVYQNPPQIQVGPDGAASGFYVDVLGAIAADEHWRLEYVPCSFTQCLGLLESGEMDLLVSIAHSEERERRVAFSRRAMLSNWGRVFRNPGVVIESILDLDGRRVAVHRGDIYYRRFDTLRAKFGISCSYVEADDYDAVLALVESGEADAGIVSRLHGLLFARERQVLPTTIEFGPSELRFAAPKGDPRGLLAAIDIRLAALQADKESVFYRAQDFWFRGTPGPWWRPPNWLLWVAAAAGALLLLVAATSLLLRRQVRLRTADLARTNELLRMQIEQRGRAEARLAESEARFRALFEAAIDGMLIADAETRRFLFANPAMCRMLGREPDEIPRLRVDDIHPARDLPAVVETFERQAASELTFAEGVPLLRGDGSVLFADVNASPVTIAGRACLLGVFRDTTERRAIEEQLQQAQKMEAIGRLAGGVAHDFNNLLTVIGGTCELLLAELPAVDPHRVRVEQVLGAAQRAGELTRSLLVFARRQPILRKALDVNAVVRKVEAFLARIIGEDVAVRVETAGEPLPVVADAAQLEQMILNLATNARDAMPSGGALEIRAEAITMPEAFATVNGLGEPGRYARISVRDTGVGMSAATLEKIFEPFFTTKPPGKGTGLGLSTVFGVVTGHRGHIQVASEPGAGTTFLVYLPVRRPEEAAPEAPAAAAGPARRAEGAVPPGATVLLAEDSAPLRELARTILERGGYAVIPVGDGAEAIAAFAANRDAVRVAALDMIMPNKGGREAAREMRAMKPGLRVLYLSGYDEDFTRLGEVLGPDDGFLQKPFTAAALLRSIRALIEGGPPAGAV